MNISNEEMLCSMNAIYKFVFETEPVHRNIIRKKLLNKGKISSKEKFYHAVEELLKSGNMTMVKENFYLNPDIIEVGKLDKIGDDFIVRTTDPRVMFKMNKSVVAGYKKGDSVDIVISKYGDLKSAVILGKSKKQFAFNDSVKTKKEVLKKKDKFILGRVVKTGHDNLVFIPNKKNFPVRQIPILNNKEEFSSFQDKICILSLKDKDVPSLGGYIKQVKGNACNPIHEYDAIAENYGAIMSWSGSELEKEITKIPKTVDTSSLSLITEDEAKFMQKGNVVDLRHLPFATVDPATCKDMDDAIYSTFNDQGDIVCYAAVANVTKYVDLDSKIGQRYLDAGFTIYAPNKAYNILPTELSTGICSLNPDEDRLAFVVKTVIDRKTGLAKSSNIYDAIIRSRKKYSYEQAQAIVDEMEPLVSKGQLLNKYLSSNDFSEEEQILMNYYAAKLIKLGQEKRNMIKFTPGTEKQVVFNEDFNDIVDIVSIPHLYYHEVIEAFMVTANETTAKYAKDNKLSNIYRVHSEPNEKKATCAYEFFNIFGIDFSGDVSIESLRDVIEQAKDSPYEDKINQFLIRMQSRAEYSSKLYSDDKKIGAKEQKISHFALQSPHYSHTTSPIRRVPDYVTQYNILAHLHDTKPIPESKILDIIENVNKRQIAVDNAEKDFESVNAVIYAEHHIGDVMSGRISSFRPSRPEDHIDEEIIVIAENEEKGIKAEIPLSKLLGKRSYYCGLSEQECAVIDESGEVLLTICQPLDFIIEKADRKAMKVVGNTNPMLIKQAEIREEQKRQNNLNKSLTMKNTISKDQINSYIETQEK